MPAPKKSIAAKKPANVKGRPTSRPVKAGKVKVSRQTVKRPAAQPAPLTDGEG